MSEFLRIELDGERELVDQLTTAVRRLQQPSELLRNIGALMEVNVNRRFDTKRDPAGQPWEPLAESTAAQYAQRYKGRVPGGLLERTRQMRQSLAANATDDYVEIGFSRLTTDGNWAIAMLHEHGTRTMPRRGLLTADPDAGELGTEDREDILGEIADFLDDLFGT